LTQINKIFYSKLLLYGEYTVTIGSGALALPYLGYSGSWTYNNSHNQKEDGLQRLAAYLESDPYFQSIYDIARFLHDIADGIEFVSNIPTGYGLGSSGALVAAFYDRYCFSLTSDLNLLRSILGATESAFHGASSGLDPLVSYLNEGILLQDSGSIEKIDLNIHDSGYFLVDTGIPRHTEYYVDLFKQKIKKSLPFSQAVLLLAKENKRAIHATLTKDKLTIYQSTKAISKIQLEHFGEMIPDKFQELWMLGLRTNDFYLKLCGAGGGGMILGLLSDPMTNIDFITNMKTIRI